MKNATQKLISEITKIADVKIGKVCVDQHDIEYRHDRYTTKYPTTAYWLANLFAKAAEENGKKNATQFSFGLYSFHFDRAKYVGQQDGKISFTIEVEITKAA